MSRPRKNIVDYFPHIARSGKTVFILEQEFGNDGYAALFKILEIFKSKVTWNLDRISLDD